MQEIVVGAASTEGECNVKGRAALASYPDTTEVFHKIICVKR